MSEKTPIARIGAVVLAVTAGTLLFFTAAGPTIANAADEDTSASVYLVFDPETGDFVTVHDPDGQALATETQESIDSAAAVTDVAAAPADGQSASTGAAGGGISSTLIIGIVAVAVVLAGLMFMQRRRSAS